jgi:hypothetical protein
VNLPNWHKLVSNCAIVVSTPERGDKDNKENQMTTTATTTRINLESATKSIDLLLAEITEKQNLIYDIKNALERKNSQGLIVTDEDAQVYIERLENTVRWIAKAGEQTAESFAYSINAEATANAELA